MTTYRYILFKDRDASSKTAHTLLNSLVISLVLKTIYDIILFRIAHVDWVVADDRYLIWIFVFSTSLGLIIAQMIRCKLGKGLLEFLHIDRTFHENIWDDIMKPNLWVRVWLRDSNKSYYGQIKYRENYEREPLIVLEYYRFLDEEANVLVDNTSDPKKKVLLNLAQLERVEIVES